MLFEEGGEGRTAVEVTARTGPALESSETKPQTTGARGDANVTTVERPASYRLEISEWSAAIRTGRPLRCGPEKAMGSAFACLAANRAVQGRTRVELT
jgi:hypothetical protein